MKSLALIAIILTAGFANASGKVQKRSMCESIAVKAALADMDKANSVGHTDENDKPSPLHEEEKASVSQVDYLDKNGDTTNVETGIYGVVMSVMEECLDGSIVTTKKAIKNGKETCEVIDLKSYGDRDCG